MADVIKVAPDQLKSQATSLGELGRSIKTTTGEMLSLVTGISKNIWSGEASSSFLSKFSGLQDGISQMCKRLEDQSSHLHTIAAEYEKTEEANKASAATLKNAIS
ncbi:MAG: WXG100 family type VII secretion target [Eubacterium sp.]|nr:WXG100 family type VII secretion target [Eubacterium sp.]